MSSRGHYCFTFSPQVLLRKLPFQWFKWQRPSGNPPRHLLYDSYASVVKIVASQIYFSFIHPPPFYSTYERKITVTWITALTSNKHHLALPACTIKHFWASLARCLPGLRALKTVEMPQCPAERKHWVTPFTFNVAFWGSVARESALKGAQQQQKTTKITKTEKKGSGCPDFKIWVIWKEKFVLKEWFIGQLSSLLLGLKGIKGNINLESKPL